MDRKLIVLAALAPAEGATHSPVQVQKLLFLIDKNIPELVKGPLFNFEPYDYGPFDTAVYEVIDGLAAEGLVEVVEESGRSWKRYRLSETGQAAGKKALNSISKKGREYIEEVSRYVRSLTFAQLVSAIYRAYPEMKVNSVFGK